MSVVSHLRFHQQKGILVLPLSPHSLSSLQQVYDLFSGGQETRLSEKSQENFESLYQLNRHLDSLDSSAETTGHLRHCFLSLLVSEYTRHQGTLPLR